VINRKHLGVAAVTGAARVLARNLAHGQTNFARMLWKFNSVYNASRQVADHRRTVRYELPLPVHSANGADRQLLYLHNRPSVHAHKAGSAPSG
jgi:hopanoid C-3 methylase